MEQVPKLVIDNNERIFLNDKKLDSVVAYKLENSADSGEPAKLTVTMLVNVDQVGLAVLGSRGSQKDSNYSRKGEER